MGLAKLLATKLKSYEKELEAVLDFMDSEDAEREETQLGSAPAEGRVELDTLSPEVCKDFFR
jgi:hypothetical protein